MRAIQRLFDRNTEPNPLGGMRVTAKGSQFIVIWCGFWEAAGFFYLFSVPELVKDALPLKPGESDPARSEGQAFALMFPIFAFGIGCAGGAIALAVIGSILRAVDSQSARSKFSDWDA